MCHGFIKDFEFAFMKLSDFDYKYPKGLIAQRPLSQRDASRMMVVERKSLNFGHSNISDLPKILKEGDLLVLNDSKVVPARLFGTRGRGEIVEVLVAEQADGDNRWRCLVKNAKRIRAGEKFFFGMHATATALGREGVFLVLGFKPGGLDLAIKHHGVPPLPPYIERNGYKSYSEEDRARYQTVFAKSPGSAAAPTAGLHFSDALLGRLKDKGVEIAYVTLHVGIDTFTPVRADDISDHEMHGERIEIDPDTAETVNRAKSEDRRVIACGTTAVRALESGFEDGKLQAGCRTTRLFITPGYKFRVADAMLTNFHQPKSTLLMLVSAFAGREFILECYEAAIEEKYRLFSYGDCMVIV